MNGIVIANNFHELLQIVQSAPLSEEDNKELMNQIYEERKLYPRCRNILIAEHVGVTLFTAVAFFVYYSTVPTQMNLAIITACSIIGILFCQVNHFVMRFVANSCLFVVLTSFFEALSIKGILSLTAFNIGQFVISMIMFATVMTWMIGKLKKNALDLQFVKSQSLGRVVCQYDNYQYLGYVYVYISQVLSEVESILQTYGTIILTTRNQEALDFLQSVKDKCLHSADFNLCDQIYGQLPTIFRYGEELKNEIHENVNARNRYYQRVNQNQDQKAREEQKKREEQRYQESQKVAEEQRTKEQRTKEQRTKEDMKFKEEQQDRETQRAKEEQKFWEEQRNKEEQRFRQEQQARQEQRAREEQEFKEEQRARQEQRAREERKAKEEQKARQEQMAKNISMNAVAEQLFLNCENQEQLTKVYKNLVKTYHPDTGTGNSELLVAISEVYEQKKRKLH